MSLQLPLRHIAKSIGIVTVVNNITTVSTVNRLIKRKTIFADILFDLSRTIFTSNQLNFDAIVNHSLKVLGDFSGADRAYIFLYREGETMDNTHGMVCCKHIS